METFLGGAVFFLYANLMVSVLSGYLDLLTQYLDFVDYKTLIAHAGNKPYTLTD